MQLLDGSTAGAALSTRRLRRGSLTVFGLTSKSTRERCWRWLEGDVQGTRRATLEAPGRRRLRRPEGTVGGGRRLTLEVAGMRRPRRLESDVRGG